MIWLHAIAETSGHPTGGIVMSSVDDIAAVGERIAKTSPIHARGVRLVKKERYGYCLALGLMQRRVGPSALEQFRRIAGDSLGFDVGASVHAGQVVSTPPSNLVDDSALAGFYLTHGIVGNPMCIEVLKMAVRQPEYRIGVAVAVRSINEGRKGRIQKIVESVIGI